MINDEKSLKPKNKNPRRPHTKKDLEKKIKSLQKQLHKLQEENNNLTKEKSKISGEKKRIQTQFDAEKSRANDLARKTATQDQKYAELSETARDLLDKYQKAAEEATRWEKQAKQLQETVDTKITERKAELKILEAVRDNYAPPKGG